ncbi:hypothetical protein A2V68_00730 [candidate division Kazan bacterium RBG_13_50_9]|uniref:Uncharacterized protein n=1 Tax=candidate division Kazan bacterium RBG_13_50_9 TaxID=1798535 RepID=A0A1F4NS39_UNCK3|nr:MAG: hypothetical protein A2V68_00730 [candidate division Kazan bacterium RBG_13_50_9]
MPKIYHLAIVFLVLGVIFAELLPNLQQDVQSRAYSQDELLPTQSDALLAFLEQQEANQSAALTTPFISEVVSIPQTLESIAYDLADGLPNGRSTNPYAPYSLLPTTVAPQIPSQDQAFIGDIIPPTGTALSQAYQQGGYAWYEETSKVIVIMSDGETLRSFNKITGEEIDWLQDRLSYDPLDSPNALDNYINNYHGQIVAETSSWALVKFPSGGFIKIAKPSTQPVFLTQP